MTNFVKTITLSGIVGQRNFKVSGFLLDNLQEGKVKKTLIAACFAAAAAFSATAVSATTFMLDEALSSITLTEVGGGCFPGSCSLSASLGAGATGYTFVANSAGASDTVADFIDWNIIQTGWQTIFGTIPPSGGGVYDVVIDMFFSAPTPASGGGTGTAGFVTLAGSLSGGFLSWTNGGIGSIAFGDGSVLGYDLHEVLLGGLGSSTTSGVTFTATQVPAPVPLPAAGLLLLGGLGCIGFARRARKAA